MGNTTPMARIPSAIHIHNLELHARSTSTILTGKLFKLTKGERMSYFSNKGGENDGTDQSLESR